MKLRLCEFKSRSNTKCNFLLLSKGFYLIAVCLEELVIRVVGTALLKYTVLLIYGAVV